MAKTRKVSIATAVRQVFGDIKETEEFSNLSIALLRSSGERVAAFFELGVKMHIIHKFHSFSGSEHFSYGRALKELEDRVILFTGEDQKQAHESLLKKIHRLCRVKFREVKRQLETDEVSR